MIDKIHDIVEILKATGISQDKVFSLLHEKVGVKKISARWYRVYSQRNVRWPTLYKKGIEMLEKRCNECITLEGDYVDK